MFLESIYNYPQTQAFKVCYFLIPVSWNFKSELNMIILSPVVFLNSFFFYPLHSPTVFDLDTTHWN